MNISILIIDDDHRKHGLLKTELKEKGVGEESIFIAEDAAKARKLLGERSFDLLLLDINLPRRAGDLKPASAEVGHELLLQIVEDNEFSTVSNVVGITSDITSMEQYEADFRRLTTQILLIDPVNTEWRTSLRFIVERLQRSENRSFDVDVCMITALREPEQQEVLKLPVDWTPEESLGNGILFRRGQANVDGKTIRLISAHSTQMGLVAATFITQSLIEKFRPRLLLMTGICGGVGDKIAIGDIVIAERSWDWQNGKWLHNGDFEISPDSKDASAELIALTLSTSQKLEEMYYNYRGSKPNTLPKLYVGPMVSGSAVVADPKMHERFINQHRKCIAVDMECYGFYFAAQHIQTPSPKFLCIKSVSDLANRAKSDNYQSYCSYMSAMVAMELISSYSKNW